MHNQKKREQRGWPDGGLKVVHLVMGLGVGGAERLLADALPLFPKSDYNIEVAAIGMDGPMGALLRERGVRVETFGGSYANPRFLPRLRRYLSSNKPHILHTHLYWPGFFGRIMGRLSGVEIIVSHLHFMANLISPWRRWLERPTWRMADAVVAISDAVLKSWEPYIPQTLCQRVIPNGVPVDSGKKHPNRIDARRLLGAVDDDIVVGWVGRMDEPVKCLGVLIDAAKILAHKLPRLKWVLIGDGPDRKSLQDKTTRLGLDDKMIFLGEQLSAREMYSGMDMFALPSRFEGMPICVLEAMAAGVPVIASSVAGIPELVADNATGTLVAPEDSRAFADAVLHIAKDPNKRVAMGEAGRKRVAERFSLDKFVENIDRLYRQLWCGD